MALTWQNLIPQPGTNQPVELRAQDIDTLIRIAGQAEQQETALYFTLHADTAGGVVQQNNASRWSQPERLGRPRWRSMVTPLSPTGLDLTRDEYLEFWVFQDPATRSAEAAGVRLVFDLGPPGCGSAGGAQVPRAGGPTVGWALANRSGNWVANL